MYGCQKCDRGAIDDHLISDYIGYKKNYSKKEHISFLLRALRYIDLGNIKSPVKRTFSFLDESCCFVVNLVCHNLKLLSVHL